MRNGIAALEAAPAPRATADPRPATPRIALVSGFWGQNIGNAFFNVGGKWLLENALPGAAVDFIQDQPGYRTFHNQAKGNPPRDLGLLRYLRSDVIVLQGPMLTRTFEALWGETLRALKARGTRIVLLSAALFQYDRPEIARVRRFLKECPPDIVVTRDTDTFEALHDIVPVIHSGVDSAFFVPRAYTPFDLELGPFVVANFDRYPEPDFAVSKDRLPSLLGADGAFEGAGLQWAYRTPRLVNRFANAGQWQAYLGHLLDRRKLPDTFGGMTVVRPEHRFNPHLPWKIYKQPNGIASDEPFTYFSIYGGSTLTLSDRVHACVVTLAYGNPAMLFAPTPRRALFARFGLESITTTPVSLPPDRLLAEQEAELAFIRGSLGPLL